MSAPIQEAAVPGVLTTPQGTVPAIGVPNSQDYPRLVVGWPYFEAVAVAEILNPAVLEAVQSMLPTLVPPYVNSAANAAVQALAVQLVGSTMTGPLMLSPPNPTAPTMAATKQYVDTMVATSLPEVPPVPAGQAWMRETGQWVPASAGGTVTNIATGNGLIGGPITGAGTISMAPAAALTLKGNNTGATAPVTDLTVSQAMTMLGAAPLTNPVFTNNISIPTNGSVYLNGLLTGTAGRIASDGSNMVFDLPGTGGFVFANAAGSTTFLTLNASFAAFSAAASLQTGQAIYFNGAGAGTASRIASDGNNMLVSTPTTTGAFVVENSTGATNFLTLNSTGAVFSASLSMPNNNALYFNGGLAGTAARIASDGTNLILNLPAAAGAFIVQNSAGSAALLTLNNTDAAFSANISIPAGHTLYLNGTTSGTAARLTSDGTALFMNVAAPGGYFYVSNSAGTINGMIMDDTGNLTMNGPTATKPGSTSWVNPSERSLKQDIEPYAGNLASLLPLVPVTYRYADDSGFDSTQTHVGLVHDETAHMPEMHRKARLPGPLDAPVREVDALDCSALTFCLVNAVKELSARITTLEGRT